MNEPIDQESTQHIYQCELCKRTFTNKGSYWRHSNRKKTFCLTKERCQEIVEENQVSKCKLSYFEIKTQKQREVIQKKQTEISKLKTLVSKFSDKDLYVKESITNVMENVNELKDTMEESKQKFFTAGNQQQLINNQTNNFIKNDNKTLFQVDYSKPSEEKLTHITKEMMLEMLNKDDFNITLNLVTRAIYFHPCAPQNWRWCLTDMNAKYGALEYNPITHTLVRKSTQEVINNNIQNVIYPLSDLLDELRRTTNFNKHQAVNCNRLTNLLGNDLSQKQSQSVKKAGYEGRNFPKVLWDSINVPVETTDMTCQIKL